MVFVDGNWKPRFTAAHGDVVAASDVDSDGNAWLITKQRGLLVLPRGGPSWIRVLVDITSADSLTVGTSGRLYIRSRDKVYFLRRSGIGVTLVAAPAVVSALMVFEDRDGDVWIAGATAAATFISAAELNSAEAEGRAPAMQVFSHADGLTSDFTPNVVEDAWGDIWFATNHGLDRFRPATFTTMALPADINSVSSATDGAGNVWVASENHPVLRIAADGARTETTVPPVSIATFSDPRDGTAWVAARKVGLFALQPTGAVPAQTPSGPAPNVPWQPPCILRDHRGEFYACQPRYVPGADLMVSSGGQWKAVVGHRVDPLVVAQSPDDSIWVGGRTANRLYQVVDGRVVGTFDEKSGLSTGAVRAIFPTASGMWVAGDGEVQWFDGHQAHTVRWPSSVTVRPVAGIAEDRRGNLWIHALGGLFLVGAGDAARAKADSSYIVRPRRFTESDGLPGPPLLSWTHPSVRFGPDGRLWVLSQTGLSWVDPDHLPAPGPIPSVVIDGMDAGDTAADLDKVPIVLSPAQRAVRVRYTAPALDTVDDLRFLYRLSGMGDGWLDAGSRREATFTNLAPGKYRFEVVAVDGLGRRSPVPATLAFERRPAVPEMLWFRALGIVPLLLLFWFVHELRARAVARQLRIRSDEREVVARQIHDTLLQRLSSLTLTLRRLASDPLIPAAPRSTIDHAVDEAVEAMTESRDQIASLRGEGDNGLALLDHLTKEGRALEGRYGVSFSVTAQGTPRTLVEDVVSEMRDVGLEALRNAFAHAHASRISLTVNYEERTFWLVVLDDGVGMAPGAAAAARKAGHYGLTGMGERVQRLQGRLVIESAPGEGTEVHVGIPARRAYGRPRRWWSPVG